MLLVIGLAVIGSIAAELICGRSICACLRQFGEPIDEFMVALLPLASAVSVSKIADTIGMIDHGAMLGEISMDEICKKGIGLEDYYLDLLGGGGKGEEPYFSGN